ncbi:MAG: NAD-dependent epimerase/dehydratase family protein [Thermodesulfobacteriota bacterium]|nr:NAD-dependent epimerase/dehydratase family protein [Thermodesulfobacteriota bacterium]
MTVKTKPNILVTGGGGFLGKAIVKMLLQAGENVRSFSRNFYPELESMGVDQIQGDIGEHSAVIKACHGIQAVFHTAAKPPPWGNYADYYRTNVVGTQNVIDACNYQKVSKLVYTSTPSVVFNGTDIEGVDETFSYPARYATPYSETKALAEQKVVKSTSDHLRTIILRPHEIWGPGDNHIAPRLIARAKRLKRIGNGKNLIDTTYIDNAVDAHLLAYEKLEENPAISGMIYFISQDEPVLAWDMINAFLKAAGLGPVKKSVPYRIAWLSGAFLEMVYKIFRLSGEPYITRFMAYAAAKSHWFNISAAKRDLGYSPRVSIEEGLIIYQEWLKKNK